MNNIHPTLENSLRDTPHLYLKAQKVAFTIVCLGLTYSGGMELLERNVGGAMVLGGEAIVAGVGAAVHARLDRMKYGVETRYIETSNY